MNVLHICMLLYVSFLGLPYSYVLCVCFYVCEGVPVVVVLFTVAVLSELLAVCAVVHILGVPSCGVCWGNGTVWFSGVGFFLWVCVCFYYKVTSSHDLSASIHDHTDDTKNDF
jgi:hypothetical protein